MAQPHSPASSPTRHAGPVEHDHPGPRVYVNVAIILAIVTAAEVGVYYIDSIRDAIAAFLIPMMVIKFALVALYFMHLKFDSKVFRRFFVTGIILAIVIYTIVLLTFLHVVTA